MNSGKKMKSPAGHSKSKIRSYRSPMGAALKQATTPERQNRIRAGGKVKPHASDYNSSVTKQHRQVSFGQGAFLNNQEVHYVHTEHSHHKGKYGANDQLVSNGSQAIDSLQNQLWEGTRTYEDDHQEGAIEQFREGPETLGDGREYHYISADASAGSERETALILKEAQHKREIARILRDVRQVPISEGVPSQVFGNHDYSSSDPAQLREYGEVPKNRIGGRVSSTIKQAPRKADLVGSGIKAEMPPADFFFTLGPKFDHPKVPPTIGMRNLRHYPSGTGNGPISTIKYASNSSSKTRTKHSGVATIPKEQKPANGRPLTGSKARQTKPNPEKIYRPQFPQSAKPIKMKKPKEESIEVLHYDGIREGSLDNQQIEVDFYTPVVAHKTKCRTMNQQSLAASLAEQQSFERAYYESSRAKPSHLSTIDQPMLAGSQSRSNLARIYGSSLVSPKSIVAPVEVSGKGFVKKNRRLVTNKEQLSQVGMKKRKSEATLEQEQYLAVSPGHSKCATGQEGTYEDLRPQKPIRNPSHRRRLQSAKISTERKAVGKGFASSKKMFIEDTHSQTINLRMQTSNKTPDGVDKVSGEKSASTVIPAEARAVLQDGNQPRSEKSIEAYPKKATRNPSLLSNKMRKGATAERPGHKKAATEIDPEDLIVEVSLKPVINAIVEKKTRAVSNLAQEQIRAEAEKVMELEKLIEAIKREEETKVSVLQDQISSFKSALDYQQKLVANLKAALSKAESVVVSKSEEVVSLADLCLELQKKLAKQTGSGNEGAVKDLVIKPKAEEPHPIKALLKEQQTQTEKMEEASKPIEPKVTVIASPPVIDPELLNENKKLKRLRQESEIDIGALEDQLAEAIVDIYEFKIVQKARLKEESRAKKTNDKLRSELQAQTLEMERLEAQLTQSHSEEKARTSSFEEKIRRLEAQNLELQKDLAESKQKQEQKQEQKPPKVSFPEEASSAGSKSSRISDHYKEDSSSSSSNSRLQEAEDRAYAQARQVETCEGQIHQMETGLKEIEIKNGLLVKENLALTDEMEAMSHAKEFTLNLVLKTANIVRAQKQQQEQPRHPIVQTSGSNDKEKAEQVKKIDDEAQGQIIKLKAEINELKENISSLKTENASLKGTLREGEAVANELKKAESSLKQAQAKVTDLEGQVEELAGLVFDNALLRQENDDLIKDLESIEKLKAQLEKEVGELKAQAAPSHEPAGPKNSDHQDRNDLESGKEQPEHPSQDLQDQEKQEQNSPISQEGKSPEKAVHFQLQEIFDFSIENFQNEQQE